MRRPRGPGGRFLTAEEIAAQQKAVESADPSTFTPNPNPSAEERKAMKAADTAAAGSSGDGAQSNGHSFGSMNPTSGTSEPSINSRPEFRPFENTNNVTTDATRDTSRGFPVTGRQTMSSSGPQVQFSDLNAAPPSGAGL